MKLNAGGLGTPNSTRMRIKGDAGCRHGQVTLGRLGEPCTSKPSQPSTNQLSGDWKPKSPEPSDPTTVPHTIPGYRFRFRYKHKNVLLETFPEDNKI
jgi:hypothetical protein